tara:strand:+ start:5978 stop:6607 length:630 start_codon:yes stop_codon:yes gene_type:complete
MNKLKNLLIILSVLFISSCKNSSFKNDEINLIVNDFNMSQLSNLGEKLYVITSPISKFNKQSQIYMLDKTKIIFYEDKNVKYTVNSNNAELLNNEIIKLNGNIEIVDVSDDKNIINADSFYWDLKKSNFILEGNVRLNNKNLDLLSSKAFLNKDSNIVKFSKPVKYNYKNKKSTNYRIRSENAYYDLSNESLIFKSESDKGRVKSKINF